LSDGLALDLGHLTAADVVSFVAAYWPHQSHHTASLTVTALRSLLGFLHIEGIIEQSLTAYGTISRLPAAGRTAQGTGA
jgi:integrase/recombinase XerD